LCVGLFTPSQSLLKEVTAFLRTRQHPVAADCFNRLQKNLRSVFPSSHLLVFCNFYSRRSFVCPLRNEIM
jgi:hypothetical protein